MWRFFRHLQGWKLKKNMTILLLYNLSWPLLEWSTQRGQPSQRNKQEITSIYRVLSTKYSRARQIPWRMIETMVRATRTWAMVSPCCGKLWSRLFGFLFSCAVSMMIIVIIINGNSGGRYQFLLLSHDHHFINTHALLLFSWILLSKILLQIIIESYLCERSEPPCMWGECVHVVACGGRSEIRIIMITIIIHDACIKARMDIW